MSTDASLADTLNIVCDMTSQLEKMDSIPTESEGRTSVALLFRNRSWEPAVSRTGQKRYRSDSKDDLSITSITDSEENDDLEDALNSDQDGDHSGDTTLPRATNSETKRAASRLAYRASQGCSRWRDSARYIQPPEHRIPPPKRSKTSTPGSRSILVETEDPNDTSTILILRFDGYTRLACPFYVSSPAHHESCVIEYDMRSIPDLIKHLMKCHPTVPYCPICGEIFDSDSGRDRHIRVASCVCRDFDIPKGVSRSQLRKLIKQDDRNQRESKRWQRIYCSLFPEKQRPRRASAYLGEGLPLAVSMARDYWALHGKRLTREYLADLGSSEVEDLEALCEQAGMELVQLVVADARNDEATLPERDGKFDEAEWETVEASEE